MTKSRFEILLQKFKAHTLEPPEYDEFMEAIRDGQHDDLLSDDILQAISSHEPVGKLTSDDELNILAQIKKDIHTVPVYRRAWFRAAAAIFIGISLGTYFLIQHQNISRPQISVVTKKSDILPGSNKAILTLGNGSKIILDSAHMGLLATQSGTKIIKSDSGQVAYQNNKSEEASLLNTLATPRGGEYQLLLPDGTKAWLNAASSITYPTAFNNKNREVSITGEVYFEVKHDPKTTFTVKVSGIEVEDIGTHFNINAYADEAEIKSTLLEGKINVITQNSKHILSPGQQADINADRQIKVINEVDLTRIIAWQQGRFEFNQTTLPVILRQISRWYDVDIKTEGTITTETFGGGISRNLPLSSVLKLLEANGLQFKLENKTLFVSNKTK